MPMNKWMRLSWVRTATLLSSLLWTRSHEVWGQNAIVDLPPLQANSLSTEYRNLFFSTPSMGYVLTDTQVLRTSDAGGHWELRWDTGREIEQVAFLSDSVAWLRTAGSYGKLYRTLDGFSSLQEMSTQFQRHDKPRMGIVHKIFFLDADRGWATGGNHVAVTTDGGRNWVGHLIPSDLGYDVNRLLMFSPTEGIAATNLKIIGTTDGGMTWRGIPDSPGDISDLRCVGRSLCITLDLINGVFASTDGGATWQPQQLPIDAGHLEVQDDVNNLQLLSPTRAYIFGSDNHIPRVWNDRLKLAPDGKLVVRRYDSTSLLIVYDGRTWTRRNYDNIRSIGRGQFVDELNGWAVSGDNNIFRTTDGGQTWTPVQDYFRQIAALTPSPTPFVLPTPGP